PRLPGLARGAVGDRAGRRGAGHARRGGSMSGGQRVSILSYHDVSPDPHPAFRRYSATVREFERQMRWLTRRGYAAIDLDAFLSACSGRIQLPPRSVIITFDDGFRSCVEHA